MFTPQIIQWQTDPVEQIKKEKDLSGGIPCKILVGWSLDKIWSSRPII